MAANKQRSAARSNVKKAQSAAKQKQTLKNLPTGTRTAQVRIAVTPRTPSLTHAPKSKRGRHG